MPPNNPLLWLCKAAQCDLSSCCCSHIPSPSETESGRIEKHTNCCRTCLPADARVLRLAGRRDWPPRVIFTVSTIISTVDSYQYCSKPVVEWNKLHLKHHLPVWGLWPESETESLRRNFLKRFQESFPSLHCGYWWPDSGQIDGMEFLRRTNGCPWH